MLNLFCTYLSRKVPNFLYIILYYLIDKKGSEGRLLWGFLTSHQQICSDSSCPLERLSMGISKDNQENVRNMTNLIRVDNKKIRSIIYEYIQKIYTTNSSKYFLIISHLIFQGFEIMLRSD